MKQTSQEFIDYYDNLYNSGYMDEWEASKKSRILEFLDSIKLPKNGRILDFGCGTGVFTNLLKSKFPDCEVVGCEITNIAIKIARQKYKNCVFLTNDEVLSLKDSFDFVFTHHVLEHVPSIEITLKEISDVCKSEAFVLHILPCGNSHSYEYNLTKRVRNGIDRNIGNRFFYEDPGHLRRLTSDELTQEMNHHRFKITSSYFANQYYGAISWITKSNFSNIFSLTDFRKATSVFNGCYLFIQRLKLSFIYIISFAPKYFLVSLNAKPKKLKHILFIIFFLLPFILCYPFYKYVEIKSANEWTNYKEKVNGSEMYLLYIR